MTCFDCDGSADDCHMNCGPRFNAGEYHRPASIRDFVIGCSLSGVVWVKRYTFIKKDDCYSDYPLYEFDIQTIGM